MGNDPWKGEYWGPRGAVETARETFAASEQEMADVVALASVLYSALGRALADAKSGSVIAVLRIPSLAIALERAIGRFREPDAWMQINADGCETAATLLYQRARVSLFRKAAWLTLAATFAEAAVAATSEEKGHTYALALLTLGKISVQQGRVRSVVDQCLWKVLGIRVKDPNQQSRIYRNAAELYAMRESPRACISACLELADKVPGIGEDVRVKNAAMRRKLLGP